MSKSIIDGIRSCLLIVEENKKKIVVCAHVCVALKGGFILPTGRVRVSKQQAEVRFKVWWEEPWALSAAAPGHLPPSHHQAV